MISTGVVGGLAVDLTLTAANLAGRGAGRIVSTSKKIACTAIVVDRIGSPPRTMATLPVLSKLKQHGD